MSAGSPRSRLRKEAWRAGLAALDACRAEPAVHRSLRAKGRVLSAGETLVHATGRLLILGWGKAALPMLRGALAVLEAAGLPPDDGLIVVKEGSLPSYVSPGSRLGRIRVAEAAHPLPDERSEAAGRALLELASSLAPGDAALALSSGGGSSLIAVPPPELRLPDLRSTWDALMRQGIPIGEANLIRRHLSAVGGGRLGEAAGAAAVLTLVASDVPGNDPAVVASGPTLAAPLAWAEVARLLQGMDAIPPPVVELARRRAAQDAPAPPACGPRPRSVILQNSHAVSAAAADLRSRGFRVVALEDSQVGTPEEIARRLCDQLDALRAAERSHRRVAIVAGGESTVRRSGNLPGGRNQHLAACAARLLSASPAPRAFLALATDGEDGSTLDAGGLVDDLSWERVAASGLDAAALLGRQDAHRMLAASGDLVSAPRGSTNVMDVFLGLALAPSPAGGGAEEGDRSSSP